MSSAPAAAKAAANPASSRSNSAMGGLAQDAVNVQVILRCRPPSKEELASRTPQVVKCDEAMRAVTLTQTVAGGKPHTQRTYHFDKVFAPDTTQEKLYNSAVSSIVDEVLEGFNCTIFAYGQTGTGKTHTMTGDIADDLNAGAGVIPRAIHQIFSYLDGIVSEYSVKCSYLELYNEEITDLLAVGQEVPKVRIMEDRSGVVLAGIEESIVKSSKEIFALLEQGSAKRRTAETLLNKQSSRSHSVFIVTVSVREVTPEGDEVIRVGKLYLVDLAGSENITRSGAVEQRAKEAGNINKSLLTLGRVITALVEGQGHVPYRDSKLTRLLRDSLGGKTKTCIIATIAPTVQCQEETLSTLDYAHRAKNIKNKPEINAKISKTTHLKEMNFEIEKLKQMLVATREKNGVYVPAKQYEEECEERRQLAARVEEMEAEAEAVAAQHELAKQEWQEEMAKQKNAYEAQLGQLREELEATQEELRKAKLAIQERDYAISTHQRCEAALAGHAGVLNDALRRAAEDIALLFQRVDEKNSLEDSNLSLVQELRDAAVQRLAAIEAAITSTASAQGERFEGAKQLLAGFAQRKASEASALQSDMAKLQAQLDSMSSAAAAAAAALQQEGAASLSSIGAQQRQYFEQAQAAAAEAAAQVSAAYTTLKDSTTAEQQQLGTFLGEQKAAGQEVYSTVQVIVSEVRGQLQAAKSAAAAAKGAVSEKLQAQAGAVDAFEQSFLATTKSEREALLEQISSMLQSFVAKTEQEVKSAVSGLKSQITADQQSLEGSLAAMESDSHKSLAALAANEGAAQTAHGAAQAALQQGGDKLLAALQASAQRGGELHAAVEQQAADAASKLSTHSARMAAAVQDRTTALAQLSDAEQQKCSGAAQAAVRARAAMQEGLAAGFAADTEAGGSLGSLTEAGAAGLAAFATEQQAAVAGVSGLVQQRITDDYLTDCNRDKVPQQREREVPPRSQIDSLRTPAVEKVFAEFHAQLAQPDGDGAEPLEVDIPEAAEEQEEQQENTNPGNRSARGMPKLDTSELPSIKAERVVSPSALGKRSRVDGETPVSARAQQPSKVTVRTRRGGN